MARNCFSWNPVNGISLAHADSEQAIVSQVSAGTAALLGMTDNVVVYCCALILRCKLAACSIGFHERTTRFDAWTCNRAVGEKSCVSIGQTERG